MKNKLLKIYFNFFAILAKIYIKKHKPLIIWDTWSIWKTSCRMIISEILKNKLKDKIIYTSEKNFNWELWLSLSILWISDYNPTFKSVIKTILKSIKTSLFWKKLYDIIFLEYWIDHIWEIDFLLSIAKPDIAIVTKIDKVHSSQFENKDIIADEKYKLLINSKEISYLNIDDEYSKKYFNKIKSKKLFFATNYKSNNEKLDLNAKNYRLKLDEIDIKSIFDYYENNNFKINVSSNLIWEENIAYTNIWLNILDHIYKKYYNKSFFYNWVEKINLNFTMQYSRFSKFDWVNNSILIDSSYNAAPESMKKVIENFINISKNIYPDYEIILCLWEMRELWEYTKIEHENLANFTKDITKNIFVVWNSMEKYFIPKNENAKYFKNSRILWQYLNDFIKNSSKKYIILFKWSQNTIFIEEALKEVLLNPLDKENICRQENFWIKKKNEFFENTKQNKTSN